MAEPAIYYTISNGFTIKPTTTGLNTNDVGFIGEKVIAFGFWFDCIEDFDHILLKVHSAEGLNVVTLYK